MGAAPRADVLLLNVGFSAELREGLELVRIGEPMRPEFASWRYLPLFERRRQNVVQPSPAQQPSGPSATGRTIRIRCVRSVRH